MNSKAELFRQIGWSQELIEHYTICDDVDNVQNDYSYEASFLDSETAIIKYDTASSSSEAKILIK